MFVFLHLGDPPVAEFTYLQYFKALTCNALSDIELVYREAPVYRMKLQ